MNTSLRRLGAATRALLLMLGLTAFIQNPYADCINPVGQAGEQRYATNYGVMAFCDGTRWVSMAGGVSVTVNTSGGGATPAGATWDVQYNNGGALAADTSNFTYTQTAGLLKAPNISATALSITNQGTFGSILDSGGMTVMGTASLTTVSSTLIQLVSDTTAACTANLAGAQRYNSVSNTIDYCSGSAWLSLGPSSTQPISFSVNKGGTPQTGVTAGTQTQVTFSNKVFDANNNFNTGTGRYTPTVPGKYLFHGRVHYAAAPAGYLSALLVKSGSAIAKQQTYNASAGSDPYMEITSIADMNGSSDYVELDAVTPGTSFGGAATATVFEGVLLSPQGGGFAGTANPAGSTNDVQFNSGGLLAADTGNFTYTSSTLTAPKVTTSGLIVTGASSLTTISTSLIQVISNSTTTCGSNLAGGMRYNATSDTLQICTSAGWTSLASGTTSGRGATDTISSGTTSVAVFSDSKVVSFTSSGSSVNFNAIGNGMIFGRNEAASTLAVAPNHNNNSAFGYAVLNALTVGQGNAALGSFALFSTTGGNSNVGVGPSAMQNNVMGNSNVAVGDSALLSEQASSGQVAIGSWALSNVSGTAASPAGGNVAIGASAIGGASGAANNTASSNTVIGYSSGTKLTTGNSNTLVGYATGKTLTTGSSNILIGAGVDTAAAQSNQLNIGNTLFGDLSTGSVSATNISGTALQMKGQGTLGSLLVNGGATVSGQASLTTVSTSLLQVGANPGAVCNSGLAGGIRYSSISSTVEYCNGATWSGTALGNAPAALIRMVGSSQNSPSTSTVVAFNTTLGTTGASVGSDVAGSGNQLILSPGNSYLLMAHVRIQSAGTLDYAVFDVSTSTRVSNLASTDADTGGSYSDVPAMAVVTVGSAAKAYEVRVTGIAGSPIILASYSTFAAIKLGGGGSGGGGTANPAGSSGDVQYSNGSNLAADTGNFTYVGGLLKAPTVSATTLDSQYLSTTTIFNSSAFSGNTVAANTVSASTISVTALGGAGSITVSAAGSPVMTIGSNGSVGIGGPAGVARLAATAATVGGTSAAFTDGVNSTFLLTHPTGRADLGTFGGAALSFSTNAGEVARFDSAGLFYIGTTSTTPNPGYLFNPAGAMTIGNNAGTTGWGFIAFKRSGTTIGSITQNGTTGVLFNQTSDRRVKENITDTREGMQKLMALPVRDFSFRADPSHTIITGFIAQEMEKVFPEAVTTNGDDGEVSLTDKDKPWSVDYGRVTPLIVKAVQDLKQEKDAEITALKADNDNLRIEIGALRERTRVMVTQNDTLVSHVLALKAANDNLSRRVDALERKLLGR